MSYHIVFGICVFNMSPVFLCDWFWGDAYEQRNTQLVEGDPMPPDRRTLCMAGVGRISGSFVPQDRLQEGGKPDTCP